MEGLTDGPRAATQEERRDMRKKIPDQKHRADLEETAERGIRRPLALLSSPGTTQIYFRCLGFSSGERPRHFTSTANEKKVTEKTREAERRENRGGTFNDHEEGHDGRRSQAAHVTKVEALERKERKYLERDMTSANLLFSLRFLFLRTSIRFFLHTYTRTISQNFI